MQWTGLNEIREKYLAFFESKGHLRLPSYSLVPDGDNSLLLINSGMAPMKKFFTGEVTPPQKRVTTCQKCIRTPDIESVGVTARHGTYFEMLGNFSFGDYFKTEATAWAWEFCTKVMQMPEDLIWITIYEDDDEAYDIWTKQIGIAPERMVRLGKKDNFWEHGTGPCGPCSELHFDRGEKYGCGSPDCAPGCECDRYMEFWNLVFTQFDSDGKGTYTPLEHPNIDTGMGLERLACVMQGVDNLFLVDTVQNIMKHISRVAGIEYGQDPKKDVSLRVITDHIRSTVFMTGDGVMPSNEGRGYVLRRLLRRAARHGRLLGIQQSFLAQIAETVIEENKSAYPGLLAKRDMIIKLIGVEEESFARTIDQGLQLLNNLMQGMDSKVFSGADAFRLNDTYGFPLDLTKEIVAEQGMTVDEDEFRRLMKEQKDRARAARKNAGADAWAGGSDALDDVAATVFVGYESLSQSAVVLAVVKDGERVDAAEAGDEVTLVLDKTSFYAESGGQVGDTGTIIVGDTVVTVLDTTKNANGIILHTAKVSAGRIAEGDEVVAQVTAERRQSILRNHTAAHLLQAALRQVLGSHVEQAGQLVSDTSVRFDFTHFSAMTDAELRATEALVNEKILEGISVECREMPVEDAKKLGAIALFGEKYGNTVRVVSAGDFSLEFCGGTHIDNTAKLGLFKIVSESSVAAGVRRIEGVTGTGVLSYLNHQLDLVHEAAAGLKLNNPADLANRARQLTVELKEKDREIESLTGKLAAVRIGELLANAQTVGGVRVLTATLPGTGADALRVMCDQIKSQSPDAVAVLAGTADGKVTIAAAAGAQALQLGVHAGKLVGQVAKIAGGNGGGKPDLAMAGAKEPQKLDEALAAAVGIISEMLK